MAGVRSADRRAEKSERKDNPGQLVLAGIVVILVAVGLFVFPFLLPPVDEDLRMSRRIGMLFLLSPVVLLLGLGALAVAAFQYLRRRRDGALKKYENRAVDPF